jgi:hypothetical protein
MLSNALSQTAPAILLNATAGMITFNSLDQRIFLAAQLRCVKLQNDGSKKDVLHKGSRRS